MARVRRYQDGGDVNDLLKMLGKYKGAPEDKELLSSLVSESTQPSGYTQPVLPVDNKIDLIPKPAQITQAPDEVKKADWSTILANPLQAWEYIGKHGLTTKNAEGKLELTRPTKAELDAQKSNIYDSVMSMFNPSAYVEALKHMGTSVDAADQALLQGFKDGRLSPGDLSNVVGNLSDAGMQALFLSMAPMGGRTWASAIKELRRPALGARIPQEFRGSRLLGPTAETATTESSALQQLASKTPISNPQTNQPIVFYHGTSKSAGDKILAEGFTGQTSLMNRRDYAQNYATSGPRTSGDKAGTIIESHVTLNNPMNSQQNTALREQIIGEIVGKSPEQLASPGYGMTTAEWQKYNAQINREFIKRAKELGYDGVYDVNQPEIIVFDPSSIKVVGSSSRGGDPLQQLAGKKPKVKKKKYEPVSAYEESNVAASTGGNAPGSQEIRGLENYSVGEQIEILKEHIATIIAQVEISNPPLDYAKKLASYEKDLKLALEHQNNPTLNPGVYQYPSFMTGSKLEGQVSAKDGTIARSALEQLVKNKNTKTSEAIAVKDVLSEFEGKRIPYENFKQSLALDIRSAEIIPTDVYSNAGVADLSGFRKWKHNIIPKTNLYKDASLGLTKEGESHFKDTPHSFWIRSFPYENSLRVLEWQTDLKVLKDPLWNPTTPGLSSITSIIKNNPQWTDGSTSGYVVPDNFYTGLEYQISFLKQVKEKIQILQQKEGDSFVESRRNMIKDINEALILAKAEQKRVLDANPLKETIIAKSKGLSLKFLNESLLDAARQGKKYLDVPTAETMFTIEGWDKPSTPTSLIEENLDILRNYDRTLPLDGGDRINSDVELYIKNKSTEVGGLYDQLINSIEKNHPATIGTFNKLGKGSDFEDMYLDFRRKMEDATLPPDIKEFWKERVIKNIKKVKSEDGIRAKEDIIKYKANQKKINEIESRPFDIKDIGGDNPTVEQKKKMAEFYSLTEDYRNTPKLFKSTFGTEAIPFTDEFGNTYNRFVVPEKFFQTDPSKPLEIKTYKQGGVLKGLVKKYGAGGSVNGWGAQGNFTTEYVSKQPDVEELEDPNALLAETIAQQPLEEPVAADGLEVAGMGGYDEAIMGSELDANINKAVDKVPIAKMFKGIGEFGSNLIVGESTGEKRKRRQKLAAFLFAPHKLIAMRKADKSGDYHYAEKEEEESLTPEVDNSFWAKNGMKIKKPFDNGGLFKALRERRADRRIAKTPVRDASSQEVLEMLSSYGADSPMMQGEYDPREKEIVMYKDDPDTLKHEQVHAAQYGPLQRLAYKMNQDRSAPIQDPTKRKVYRKLSENISPEAYAAFNRAGKLILDKGEEFEAVLNTGVNAAKEKGVNFNVPFEEILSQLKNIPSPTNNMIGLMKFMENRFTKKQRDLILKSIR